MLLSPLIERLIEALQVLPGVGPKTATRMALHLLQHNREGGRAMATILNEAVEKVGRCRLCRNLSELQECGICKSPKRDASVLCIVESPADIVAIEQAGSYSGHYFVLHGRLSPIDGIGPEDLGLHQLAAKVESEGITEVILATNPTVEGEATAHYIFETLQDTASKLTRIAHGVPLGGELEYIDGGTIAHALQGRRTIG